MRRISFDVRVRGIRVFPISASTFLCVLSDIRIVVVLKKLLTPSGVYGTALYHCAAYLGDNVTVDATRRRSFHTLVNVTMSMRHSFVSGAPQLNVM